MIMSLLRIDEHSSLNCPSIHSSWFSGHTTPSDGVMQHEGISHQKVAHGVQTGRLRLGDTIVAACESCFRKAGYGKAVRSVCVAGGGRLFKRRLLWPDSDQAG